ncbi:MAG: hypothetical protein ABI605_06660 [Rhizobacter sp.]
MNAIAARGLAMLVLLSTLAVVAQATLIEQLLTPWRWVTETLEPDFRVVNLRARVVGSEAMIELIVEPARVIFIGGHAIVPDPAQPERAKSSMPRGATWLLLTAFVVTLVTWPLKQPSREWPARLLLGLPVLVALLMLDVPITLLGPLRSLLVGMNPGDSDAWILGSQFLRGGGRYFVALVGAAGICIAIQERLLRKKKPS